MNADLIIIGAGPAGIAAAAVAAERGKHAVLLDENVRVGGQIWRHRDRRGLNSIAREWMARLDRSGASVNCGTSVVDVDDADGQFTVTAEGEGGVVTWRARAIILATGARERFLPFPGWTLPGVMGIGGAQALLKSGTSFRGKRVVISGTGPLMMPVAAALADAGARLLYVGEQASLSSVATFAASLVGKPRALLQAATYRAAFPFTPYRMGSWVTAARGSGKVETVDIVDGRSTRTLSCDVLCAAFGLLPNTELARMLGCTIARGAHVVDDDQQTTRPSVYSAGESTGVGGVDLALVEGAIAGLAAAGFAASAAALKAQRRALAASVAAMDRAFALRPELLKLATRDTIVCRCEDVMLGAIPEGWSPRQAKLHTRIGMGACQGRVCGAAMETLRGWAPDSVRLPLQPVSLSTLMAGAAIAGAPPDQGA